MMDNSFKIGSYIFLISILISCQKKIVEYHNNGKVKLVGSLVSGKKSGEFIEFSKLGDTLLVTNYKEDKLLSRKSYFDNKLDYIDVFDSLGNYLKFSYSEEGRLISKASFKDDLRDGLYEGYHDNGQVQLKLQYRMDKIEGKIEQFYPSGVLNIYSENAETGVYFFYNESERLIKKIQYQNFAPYDTLWILSP